MHSRRGRSDCLLAQISFQNTKEAQVLLSALPLKKHKSFTLPLPAGQVMASSAVLERSTHGRASVKRHSHISQLYVSYSWPMSLMLAVPVTVRPVSDTGISSTRIIACSLPASRSLRDLEAAVQMQLGSERVLVRLQYRGCQPVLASPLLDFTVPGTSLQPRFQALVRASACISCTTPAVVRSAALQLLSMLLSPKRWLAG